MQLSYSALMLAALSLEYTLAQPAHHRHAHKHRRDLANVNWNDPANYKGVDFNTISYTWPGQGGQGGQPAPTTTQAQGSAPTTTATSAAATTTASQPPQNQSPPENNPPAAPSPSTSSSSTTSPPASQQTPASSSGGASGSFGGISSPVDNGNKDEYIGNVGIPYGSNMLQLGSPDDAKNYKYSNTFSNPTGEKVTVIVWNKSGKDGQPQSGMSLPPTLKFDLGPQESVAVAFDENSQISFAQDCERDPSKGNIPNCTWGEADFGDLRNGGWSGYDRSSIPNSAGNTGLLTISCEGAQTSSQQSNSFTSAAQTNAGGSLAPGPAHFYTTMGA